MDTKGLQKIFANKMTVKSNFMKYKLYELKIYLIAFFVIVLIFRNVNEKKICYPIFSLNLYSPKEILLLLFSPFSYTLEYENNNFREKIRRQKL